MLIVCAWVDHEKVDRATQERRKKLLSFAVPIKRWVRSRMVRGRPAVELVLVDRPASFAHGHLIHGIGIDPCQLLEPDTHQFDLALFTLEFEIGCLLRVMPPAHMDQELRLGVVFENAVAQVFGLFSLAIVDGANGVAIPARDYGRGHLIGHNSVAEMKRRSNQVREHRIAGVNGPVAQALREQTETLFTEPPQIRKLAVLASKLPGVPPAEAITKGLLLTFEAKDGHEAQVQTFLREARPLALEEPDTIAWFALNFESGEYGIFDVFPGNGGRFAHLTGPIPRELAKHALSLLGSVPEMHLLDVLADKLPS